jgi:hypothetical protein
MFLTPFFIMALSCKDGERIEIHAYRYEKETKNEPVDNQVLG